MTVIETSCAIPPTGGHTRYNDAPLSASTTDNWVARRGGLPPMVRAIARALMRSGHSESGAISLAIGAVKRWAAGGGKVHPTTRARAAAAVAHWEAIKGTAGRAGYEVLVRQAVEMGELRRTEEMDVRAATGPAGSADQKAASQGAKNTSAKGKNTSGKSAGGKKLSGSHAPGHPFLGNQHTKVASQPGVAVGGKGGSTGAIPAPSTGGGGSAASAASKAAAATAAYQAAGTTLANATLAAQKSADAHDKAQQALADAGTESNQDKLFAEQKLPSNRPNQNTAQLDAQALDAVDKSSSSRIAAAKAAAESARISHEMNLNSLAAAQTKYSAAKAAAGIRSDGMDLVMVRKAWGRDLYHHALSQHSSAMHKSERVLESGGKTQFHTAASMHDQAAKSFHDLGEQHRMAGEFSEAVAAHRVANSHETVATALRVTTEDNAVDQHEEHDLGEVRRKATSELDAYKRRTRADFVGETTGEGADKFLPAGPSKKQGDAINARLKSGDTNRHRFKGSDLDHCAECGQPLMSLTHGSAPGQPIPPVPRQIRAPHARHKPSDPQNCKDGGHPATKSLIWAEGAAYVPVCDQHEAKYVAKIGGPSEVNEVIPIDNSQRHAGPDHVHAATGHIKGVPARHVAAAASQAASHMAAVEGPLEDSMRALFATQRKGALSRLEGKRGKQSLKRAGGPNEPPAIPPEDSGTQPADIPPMVDLGAIFDTGYWSSKTAETLAPHLSTAGNLAAGAVRQQIGMDPMHDDSTSLGAMRDIIAARAQAAADYISGTTAKELHGALQEGVANGEGMAEIAKRVNDVFDQADMTRAKRIAQTEVVGAYNQGALAYASSLPSDVIGTRRWLAHHDQHTRPTHRMADGQEQPMGSPFYVGGSPMMSPGDKSAPVGEWINCRCSVAYMPPGMAYNGIAAAAEAYVAGLKAKPPPAVTPYTVPA